LNDNSEVLSEKSGRLNQKSMEQLGMMRKRLMSRQNDKTRSTHIDKNQYMSQRL